jgi:peptidoglycan biosynthesis protein MviN/MurJ (putative lipid II flippase)
VLEKNLFAMLDFNTPMTVALLALYLLILLAPFPAALTGSWIGLAGVAAIWTCALAAARQARRFGWPMWPALLSPLCLLVPPVAVTNSMIRTLARGGVTWRDTFYPLDALRKGLISPRRPESLPERRPGAERPPIAARRA